MSASERRRPRERWNSNRYFFNSEVLVIILAEFTRAEARSANKSDGRDERGGTGEEEAAGAERVRCEIIRTS